MEHFSGMCIGGPWDGRQAVLPTQWMRYSDREELRTNIVSADTDKVDAPPYITRVYRHRILWRGRSGEEISAWIHDDLTLEQAILRVFQFYVSKGAK